MFRGMKKSLQYKCWMLKSVQMMFKTLKSCSWKEHLNYWTRVKKSLGEKLTKLLPFASCITQRLASFYIHLPSSMNFTKPIRGTGLELRWRSKENLSHQRWELFRSKYYDKRRKQKISRLRSAVVQSRM